MSYIGQQPLNNYVTKQSQTFTPDGSTVSFTLDFAVTSGIDIMLVINNVVQEPGAGKSYTASGTTLTMSEAPGASDSMYCIFLGLALQTVNPGDASVGTSKLTDSAVTNAKIANSTIDLTSKVTGTLPLGNGGIGATTLAGAGITNTPAFMAYLDNDVSVSDAVETKVAFNQEEFDTDSAFDNATNYRFTVPSGKGGKYFIHYNVTGSSDPSRLQYVTARLKKNGTLVATNTTDPRNAGFGLAFSVGNQLHLDLSAGDYLEVYIIVDPESASTYPATIEAFNIYTTVFGGHKLIGV